MADLAAIRSDFDRLAALEAMDEFNHTKLYFPWLLRQLPERAGRVVEIGCGGGSLTSLLAPRTEHLLAIDLSPAMLRLARERCRGAPHVVFEECDAHGRDLEPASLDAVVSVATLHHLRPDIVLARWAAALRPGAILVILDVLARPGAMNIPVNAVAAGLGGALRWWHTGRVLTDPKVRAAWDEHARFDRLPTMREARETARAHLPGARVRQHLFWRYSIVWRSGGIRASAPR